MVIAASWTSINGDPNLRGIATVLALARYLKRELFDMIFGYTSKPFLRVLFMG